MKTVLLALLIATPHAFAMPTKCLSPSPFTIKTTQSAAEIPAPMKKPPTIVPLGCERPFIYHGDVYSADSPQTQDGANLREFVKSVPDADAYLEQYRLNREKSKISAYTGTLGLILVLISGPISSNFSNQHEKNVFSALGVILGSGLALGGYIYSFSLLQQNEALITQGVEAYNSAKPNDTIEIKFSTGWTF